MSAVSSSTDIANWALDLMDEAEIQSLTENNKAARALNRQWQKTRTTVLSSAHWKCAKKVKNLSNDATAPTHPRWGYRSALPGDLLVIIHLWDNNEDNVDTRPLPEEHWDREAGYIHHDLESDAALEYIYDNETVSDYGPLLAEAMAYHMAASTAKKITGSDDISKLLKDQYHRGILPEAQRVEGNQGRVRENLNLHRRLKRSPLFRARYNYRIGSA